jgi:hypothetical protein
MKPDTKCDEAVARVEWFCVLCGLAEAIDIRIYAEGVAAQSLWWKPKAAAGGGGWVTQCGATKSLFARVERVKILEAEDMFILHETPVFHVMPSTILRCPGVQALYFSFRPRQAPKAMCSET